MRSGSTRPASATSPKPPARVGAYVVALSTDYVFDGTKPTPYDECDATNPQSVYGTFEAAPASSRSIPRHAVVRTSWIVGRYGANMVKTILRLAGEHEKLSFVSDQRGHPTIAADLARMLVRFARSGSPGPGTSRTRARSRGTSSPRRCSPPTATIPSRVERDHDRRAPTAAPGAAARELGAREPCAARRRDRAAPRLPRVPSTCSSVRSARAERGRR